MFLRDREPDREDEEPPASLRAGGAAGWQRDLELARDALARDPAALERFIARMQCVPRFASLLNGRATAPLPREAVEDVVQDVLATVWRRLGDYRGDAGLETWVFRICDFQLRNAHRRAATRRAVSLDETSEPEAETMEPDHDREQLDRGIESLPAAEAEVLRLKHYEGLTFDQIAAQLRQSPNTVKTRYYRGLESLRRWLRKPGGER